MLMMILLLISYCLGATVWCIPEKLCIYGAVEGNALSVTIHSSAEGWVGFGVGTKMINAGLLHVAWKRNTTTIFTSRQATNHVYPSNSSTAVSLTKTRLIAVPIWAKIAFTFLRPLSLKPAILPNSTYIYAYSSKDVFNPSSPTSVFSQHEIKGSFIADFTTDRGFLPDGVEGEMVPGSGALSASIAMAFLILLL
jgi:hypothetical protein